MMCRARDHYFELFFNWLNFMTQIMLIDNTSRTKSGDMIDEVSRKKRKAPIGIANSVRVLIHKLIRTLGMLF